MPAFFFSNPNFVDLWAAILFFYISGFQAKILTKDGNITEFVDPKLDGEYSAEAFDLILKLALSCTSLKIHRPSMEHVVLGLENAHDISRMAKACTPHLTTNHLLSAEESFLN